MRLQRIIANRLSRLEGWTYATVGGNSSNFASQLYFFNAWAPLLWPVACEMESSLSLSQLRARIGSIDRRANPRTKNCPWIPCNYRVKYEVNPASEVKWRPLSHLSPVACHLSFIFSLLAAHSYMLSAWSLNSCWKSLLSSSHHSHHRPLLP